MSAETRVSSARPLWLFSRRADFWLACGGASVALLISLTLLAWHGDRELDWLDFILSEFHLGATYDAVLRRRLWRQRRVDVLFVPLVIVALTYAVSLGGQSLLLTSMTMYAAVWHRGRQSLGVARFYQRQVGGPVSRAHEVLFRGAIYLPMLASTLAYTHLAPLDYEEKPYFALNFGANITWFIGFAAVAWVTAYLAWMCGGSRYTRLIYAAQNNADQVHPGEWWVVLAHAVAFGSAYVLGATNASFLLALAVYHEVQYMYFTYAMARRLEGGQAASHAGIDAAIKDLDLRTPWEGGSKLRTELRHVAAFLVWPVIGFAAAVVGGWSELAWLAPLGIGGLFCHYWLDGRIWTRSSLQH